MPAMNSLPGLVRFYRAGSALGRGDDLDTDARGPERLILRAFVLFRVAGVAQVTFALAAAWGRIPHRSAITALAGAVALESLLLVARCWAQTRVSRTSVIIDLAFTVAALVTCARLTAAPDYNTWANFMYPFSLIAVLTVGLGPYRLPGAVLLTAFVATAYDLSARFLHGDPVWNSTPNALSYFANASVCWLVVSRMRRYGALLDEHRRQAVGQAEELARTAEHAHAARLLHDRVLQTLEMLAQPPWISDERVQSQVAAEASWLRRFIERADNHTASGLLEAMGSVCEHHVRAGLRVDVNDIEGRASCLADRQLSAHTIAALAGALDEALLNVAKHANVTEAKVRIAPAGRGVLVSVADSGCGFERGRYGSGFGQRNSIIARLRSVGGDAKIESAPGYGTQVELWVPWNGGPGCQHEGGQAPPALSAELPELGSLVDAIPVDRTAFDLTAQLGVDHAEMQVDRRGADAHSQSCLLVGQPAGDTTEDLVLLGGGLSLRPGSTGTGQRGTFTGSRAKLAAEDTSQLRRQPETSRVNSFDGGYECARNGPLRQIATSSRQNRVENISRSRRCGNDQHARHGHQLSQHVQGWPLTLQVQIHDHQVSPQGGILLQEIGEILDARGGQHQPQARTADQNPFHSISGDRMVVHNRDPNGLRPALDGQSGFIRARSRHRISDGITRGG